MVNFRQPAFNCLTVENLRYFIDNKCHYRLEKSNKIKIIDPEPQS